MSTKFLRLLALSIASFTIANCALITSSQQIRNTQNVIDFSQFGGSNTTYTDGPVQVGTGVTFASNNPDGSVLGSGPYSLNDNGLWTSSATFAGLDVDQFGGDQYTMTFSFTGTPVAAVGGFLNYATFQGSGFSDVYISALGINGAVLETYDISQLAPISTPNAGNGGVFLGIARSQADISDFALSNSAVAITDLTFSSTPPPMTIMPEPQPFGLLVIGCFFVILRRCRPHPSGSIV